MEANYNIGDSVIYINIEEGEDYSEPYHSNDFVEVPVPAVVLESDDGFTTMRLYSGENICMRSDSQYIRRPSLFERISRGREFSKARKSAFQSLGSLLNS